MTKYDNNMRGILFKNDKKQKDSHPDYKGSCEIDGIEYWISGWKKETAKGPALSINLEKKQTNKQDNVKKEQSTKAYANKEVKDFEDDIPF